jgi:hypothetical protein
MGDLSDHYFALMREQKIFLLMRNGSFRLLEMNAVSKANSY